MNSITTSVPLICTGYGTGMPTDQARQSASNSLAAQCPEATCLP